MKDPIYVSIDELTLEFTPSQATAIRAYVARCEREFLQLLRQDHAIKAFMQWLNDGNVATVDEPPLKIAVAPDVMARDLR